MSKNDIERKTIQFKIDSTTEEEGIFSGVGSGFGDIDQGDDLILPNAFDEDLAGKPANSVKCLWQHEQVKPLGYYRELTPSADGLKVIGKVLPTTLGVDAIILMKGDEQGNGVDGLSIGYRVLESRMETIDGRRIRVIEKAILIEISIVTFPMHLRCRIQGVKTMTIEEIDELKSLADVEEFLRNPKELSKEGAKKFIARIAEFKKVSGESESHTGGLTDDEREAQAKEEQKQKEADEARKQQIDTDAKALMSFAESLSINNEE